MRSPSAPTVRPRALLVALLVLAALSYGFRLGRPGLGRSEAYSALAASQDHIAAVVETALRFDPGKPPLYHILLHWFCGLFGRGETSLRAFSLIFGVIGVALLYALGKEMFGPTVAFCAALVWAFNPVAELIAQWARMYTMFVAVVLASLLAFWRLRRRPSAGCIAAFGLAGAAMLYTHMNALVFFGIEAAIAVRDRYRGRTSGAQWLGIGMALLLFALFIPVEFAQARGLLFGHWLDWVGVARQGSQAYKALTALFVAGVVLGLVFGPEFESDEDEPIRFCVFWSVVPLLALAAGSVVARPMLMLRYVTPALPGLALLIVRGLEVFSIRARNLGTAALTTAFVVMLFFYQGRREEPWREIARHVAAASAAEPVFFESGFIMSEGQGSDNEGFAQGFYRVPFDYYYSGPNPRIAINPVNSEAARETIAREALSVGGAWLISGKSEEQARAEMPAGDKMRLELVLSSDFARLYHIEPLIARKGPLN